MKIKNSKFFKFKNKKYKRLIKHLFYLQKYILLF